jgi:hypothetical protein
MGRKGDRGVVGGDGSLGISVTVLSPGDLLDGLGLPQSKFRA